MATFEPGLSAQPSRLAHPEYPTSSPFEVTDFNDDPVGWSVGGAVEKAMLNLNTAATPGVLLSAIHGAISYTIPEWEHPFMMGAGFSIDSTHDNSTATGYTLWGKVGITF